ncbi:hypothetical protein PHAVU_008G216200 [Phaseolus vulgaris]|uniref:HMA domain-containing protein n=1 Tax=Phaseolus vulgaris TaxID=3885 RepID=V7BB62_PHAVU|nr:hypothetical protein PHAVU_008G216200g [Phaseolus vulgaris]ESW13676.1 hypothetical protein PHAVU_008G216200g [Phaseolus vulgaris]
MKQKIVIKVNVASDKCRREALQIAAKCSGVQSIAFDGECNDQVVVTGDEVDAVSLTNQIRKKFRYAKLISLKNVEEEEGGDEGGQEEEQEEETMSDEIYPPSYPICSILPSSIYHQVVYDPYPNTCSIL